MGSEKGKVDTIVRFSPLMVSRIVRAHWRAKPKVPVHLIAEPSTVKSDGVKSSAIELSPEENREYFEWNRSSLDEKRKVSADPSKVFIFADVRASETDIGELRLQDMKAAEEFIVYKYNILFEALSKKDAMGILFFDEMNLASNMIKAQFYKIINDRAIGDIPLADGVLCVSAGNESEHSRGVTEDPVPLVLRRGNYFLRPLTAEEYTDYAVRAAHHEWIIGYLGFAPGDVHKIEYDVADSTGQPCPRTWSMLNRILRGNESAPIEDIEVYATGLVGQGVARKFAAYVKSAKKINLDDVLKKPERIREYENEKDLSLVYAIIGGVVERWRNDKKVLTPALSIALEMQRPEFGAYLIRSLKNVDEKQFLKSIADTKLLPEDLAKKLVNKYAKFLFERQ